MPGPSDPRLRLLADLAALAEQRALVPLRAAQSRLAASEAVVAALRQAREDLAADASDPVQAALMARQSEQLFKGQLAALSALAADRAALEIARATARPVIGRRIALERLAAKRAAAGE
jgi:hypothetical protein